MTEQKDPIEEPKDPEPNEPEPKDPEPNEPEPKEPEVKDKHGQPGINKERHEKEMKERDEKIAELQGKIDELSKTDEGRKELKGEIDKLKEEMADKDLTYALKEKGCKNSKAAKALLDDYDGDIEKLVEGAPYLFGNEKPKGSTGFKPDGAADGADEERLKKAFRLK